MGALVVLGLIVGPVCQFFVAVKTCSATTTLSTCSACTASAASSARSAHRHPGGAASAAPASWTTTGKIGGYDS
jgi:hypothetical protein